MLKCAPIITPDGVRDALELAYKCYLRVDHAERGEEFFRREFEYSRVFGAMLAGRLKLWGLADSELRGVCGMSDGERVEFVFVQPAYQRHGLGTALVETMCDYAREEKKTKVSAFATRESAEFFTALGFKPSGAMEERYGTALVPVTAEL